MAGDNLFLPEVIARADANYYASLRAIASASPGSFVREEDGVLAIAIGAPHAMFNIAFVTRPLADPRRQIAAASAWFDERRLPFVVRVREGVDPAAERACEALGMPYSDTVPGMALTDTTRATAAADGVEIREVTDDATYNQHVDVLVESFGHGSEVLRAFFPKALMSYPDFTAYVGYIDGQPIATSASLVSDRVAGVYNVGTLPEHRGRGIGEAMTCHAVREGVARGAIIAALQSSEMGRPVYERIGFRVVSPYRTFHRV